MENKNIGNEQFKPENSMPVPVSNEILPNVEEAENNKICGIIDDMFEKGNIAINFGKRIYPGNKQSEALDRVSADDVVAAFKKDPVFFKKVINTNSELSDNNRKIVIKEDLAANKKIVAKISVMFGVSANDHPIVSVELDAENIKSEGEYNNYGEWVPAGNGSVETMSESLKSIAGFLYDSIGNHDLGVALNGDKIEFKTSTGSMTLEISNPNGEELAELAKAVNEEGWFGPIKAEGNKLSFNFGKRDIILEVAGIKKERGG